METEPEARPGHSGVPVCGHQGPEARCQAPPGNTGSGVTSGDSLGQEVTTERNSQGAAQEAAGAGLMASGGCTSYIFEA